MSILNYQDAYLQRFCTPEREARAFDAVDVYGSFDAAWRNKLAQLQCYLLACLENQADDEDLFSAKYKLYRQHFEAMLTQARAAQTPADGITTSVFSVEIERA